MMTRVLASASPRRPADWTSAKTVVVKKRDRFGGRSFRGYETRPLSVEGHWGAGKSSHGQGVQAGSGSALRCAGGGALPRSKRRPRAGGECDRGGSGQDSRFWARTKWSGLCGKHGVSLLALETKRPMELKCDFNGMKKKTEGGSGRCRFNRQKTMPGSMPRSIVLKLVGVYDAGLRSSEGDRGRIWEPWRSSLWDAFCRSSGCGRR